MDTLTMGLVFLAVLLAFGVIIYTVLVFPLARFVECVRDPNLTGARRTVWVVLMFLLCPFTGYAYGFWKPKNRFVRVMSVAAFPLCVGAVGALWVLGNVARAAEVTVRVPRVRVQEERTTRKSTTTIVGPRGTRVVRDLETGRTTEVPGSVTEDLEQRVDVRGVAETGITVEKRVYRSDGVAVPADGTVIEGGPGSVHRKSTTRKVRTPGVEVRVK